jgi:hypothetical protein
LHMSCLSTPRSLHAAALEGVGHEVAAAGMEPEVGCCAAALRPFAWKRRVCVLVAAVWRDMSHTRYKGAWLQEWNRKCVTLEFAPQPFVGV